MSEREVQCFLCMFPAGGRNALHLNGFGVRDQRDVSACLRVLKQVMRCDADGRRVPHTSLPRPSRPHHQVWRAHETAMDKGGDICWPDNSYSLLVDARHTSHKVS
jgi:hypothetical protein